MRKIFSLALFPPIQFFSHLSTVDEALIEIYCHYSRQSYRNRYVILAANGVLNLSVPIIKVSGKKTFTKDVRIDNSSGWNKIHWKSIEAAYQSSPFFIYYKDDFEPLYKKEWKYLLDLDLEALRITQECTALDTKITLTDHYHLKQSKFKDYREIIHPKVSIHKDKTFQPLAYRQLFNREEFIPNLSILDLIFNKGPESLIILENSIIST